MLVSLADEIGLSCDITLYVGGTIVSGRLISHSVYFDKFDATFFENASQLQGNAGMFKTCGDKYLDAAKQFSHTAYIHLENIAYHGASQGRLSVNGALWRGRLDVVDAFAMGRT
jgi:hypothetical protein